MGPAPHWGLNKGLMRYISAIIPLAQSSSDDIEWDKSQFISSYRNEPLDTASHLVTVAVHVLITTVISIATVAKDSLL